MVTVRTHSLSAGPFVLPPRMRVPVVTLDIPTALAVQVPDTVPPAARRDEHCRTSLLLLTMSSHGSCGMPSEERVSTLPARRQIWAGKELRRIARLAVLVHRAGAGAAAAEAGVVLTLSLPQPVAATARSAVATKPTGRTQENGAR